MRAVVAVSALLCAAGCGSSEADTSLNVTWSFSSGDCASNAVQTVRVSWGPAGHPPQDVAFDCVAGRGKLGDIAASGGQYAIAALGLDAGGVARFTHFGTSLTVSGKGTGGQPVALTLRPKPADIVVTWRLANGTGCPSGVILPYFITVYRTPATDGGTLSEKVTEAQESCSSASATLKNVAPGGYVVELDSRAVTPKVKGTKPVTVLAGESATVAFQF
jgi:hypothetical protein